MIDPIVLVPNLTPEIAPAQSVGEVVSLSGETMGTTWSLKALIDATHSHAQIEQTLEGIFDAVCQVFSPWQTDSFITGFNRSAAGTKHTPPQSFQTAWATAVKIANKSSGAFNPCLGLTTRLAGFGPARLPNDNSETKPHIWTGNPFEVGTNTLEQTGKLDLDLCAIAKGYAVDLAVKELKQLNISAFLMEIGGELFGVGTKPNHHPWWIDLHTENPTSQPLRLALFNEAIATSGSLYQQRADACHITSNVPHNSLMSVSVIAPSCMEADGWATALFAAGRKAPDLAAIHDIRAVFQSTAGDYTFSPALSDYLN